MIRDVIRSICLTNLLKLSEYTLDYMSLRPLKNALFCLPV